MRKRSFSRSAFILTIAAGVAAVGQPREDAGHFQQAVLERLDEVVIADLVNKELNRGQLYDGQIHDSLVALGPKAVPALCRHLETYKFPMVIITVLAEFQDPRAVPALLDFLGKRSSDRDAIRALKEIGDRRAEPLLLRIKSDEQAHVAVRYEATAALARLGSPKVKEEAWKEITELCRTRENVSQNAWPNSEVILCQDFYLGLCEVPTEEADEELASVLRSAPGYEREPVMRLLGRRPQTRDRPKLIETLAYVAEHEYKQDNVGDELSIMATAFETLLKLDGLPPERLLRIAGTWEGAIAAERAHWPEEVVSIFADRLRQLRAEAEARCRDEGAVKGTSTGR